MHSISTLLIAYVSVSFLVVVSRGEAASYPAKPVRIITMSLPGSSTDVVARAVGSRLIELSHCRCGGDQHRGAMANDTPPQSD